MPSAHEHLELARRHLARVRSASRPANWPDLTLYGFYCLENAVVAAAIHVGIVTQKSHPSKVTAGQQLTLQRSLPDVSRLLVQLNDARKVEAYGDVVRPDLDPENLASTLAEYIEAVGVLLAQ
jgi:hypothetical protein